ncbi:MAG TPA: hypothetical protein VL486_13580 [Verrucomicrobiae bacterium]|nr:hypothetical protein [Verrucomicrobiae bacterium]
MNNTIRAVCFILGITGGLLLCMAWIGVKRCDVPRWTLHLCGLMGVLFICWGGCGLVQFYWSSHITRRSVYMLEHYRLTSGGVAAGLFIALCISGQLHRLVKKRPDAGDRADKA